MGGIYLGESNILRLFNHIFGRDGMHYRLNTLEFRGVVARVFYWLGRLGLDESLLLCYFQRIRYCYRASLSMNFLHLKLLNNDGWSSNRLLLTGVLKRAVQDGWLIGGWGSSMGRATFPPKYPFPKFRARWR